MNTNSGSEVTRSLIEELAVLLKYVIDTYCPIEYKDKYDAKDQINAFIKAMRSTGHQNANNNSVLEPKTPSQPAYSCSEISVVDECFNSRWKWTEKYESAYQSFEPLAKDWFRCGWTEALRQPEPVMGGLVSLAKCKWELSKVFVPDGIWNIEEGMKMERAAKAVLDAAGVKYVD